MKRSADFRLTLAQRQRDRRRVERALGHPLMRSAMNWMSALHAMLLAVIALCDAQLRDAVDPRAQPSGTPPTRAPETVLF